MHSFSSENDLPTEIEETVLSIAQLHIEHHRNVTPTERRISAIASAMVRPAAIGALTVMVLGWIGFNIVAERMGSPALDPVPFAGLALVVSLVSLYVMVLVLATQRQEDRLAQLREQLTLELALLSDRKTAKVIGLLEELRRDLPLVQDREDREAEALAQPADPELVVDAIRDTHEAVEELRHSIQRE